MSNRIFPNGNGDDSTATATLDAPAPAEKKAKAKKAKAKKADGPKTVTITPPKMQVLALTIRGTAPMVQEKFSNKILQMMREQQEAGGTARSKRKRDPKDFDQLCEDSVHLTDSGQCGIPATAFRNAMVDACRLVNFKMTLAKLSVFIEADVYEPDGTPLVLLKKGEWRRVDLPVRNATGVADIRPRPMWDPGWEAVVRVRFDSDQFTVSDIVNLLARVGSQVGIGAGRPSSKNSCGMGWGLFEVLPQ